MASIFISIVQVFWMKCNHLVSLKLSESCMSEIKTELLKLRDEAQAQHLSRFFKTGKGQYGEGDQFLGIKVPVTRELVKKYWRQTTLSDLEEMLQSEFHEIRLGALLVLVQMFKAAKKDPELQKTYVSFYLSHTASINNWDLVDLSCYEILGTWLLDKDRAILHDLARNGKTMWEQRIGMVSCMMLVRHGDFEDVYEVADILLHHEHDLIHKAVGWILREAGKRDLARLCAYLDSAAAGESKARYLVMPRTMLRYAIERFDEPLRQDYLKGLVTRISI